MTLLWYSVCTALGRLKARIGGALDTLPRRDAEDLSALIIKNQRLQTYFQKVGLNAIEAADTVALG
jgi:hypothetical protein